MGVTHPFCAMCYYSSSLLKTVGRGLQRRGRLLVHLEKRANSCDRVADNPILLQLSKHTANRQLYKHTAIQTHTQTNTDTHIYRYVCTVLSGSVHKVVQHSKAQHSTVPHSAAQRKQQDGCTSKAFRSAQKPVSLLRSAMA